MEKYKHNGEQLLNKVKRNSKEEEELVKTEKNFKEEEAPKKVEQYERSNRLERDHKEGQSFGNVQRDDEKDEMPNKAERTSHRVDNILRALNPTGRYQVLHVLVLLLSLPPAGLQLFSNVFTAKAVPHRCSGPPEGSDWTEIFGNIENLTVIQEKCRVVLTDNSSVIDTAACVYGIEYELPKDASAVSQFDLVCDLDWLARLSQTMVIIGQGIGATLTTFFSDRFGRKTVLVTSNFGLLIFGLAAAYAPNAIVFVIFKFVIGGFQQGVVTLTTTFFLELLPLEYRAIQSWLVGGCWGLGVMLLSLIAFFFKNSSWQALQTALSLISLLAIVQWWYMDESLRWLLANGKTKRAKKVIKRIARVNKQRDTKVYELCEKELIPTAIDGSKTLKSSGKDPQIKSIERLSLLDILRVRRLFFNSLCLWFCWFTAALSFFTIYLTATSLSGDPYLNFGLTAIMELPSNAFFFFGLNRLGRKRCLKTVYIVMGAGVLLAGMFKKLEESNEVYTTFTLLASLTAMGGASGCFSIVFSYTPEMFPTNLRSQAIGVSSFFSRIGGMLGPFAGLLAEQAVWAPGLVIGSCACFVCFLTYFLPETSKRELPQTISDLQAWFETDEDYSEPNKPLESRVDYDVKLNHSKSVL